MSLRFIFFITGLSILCASCTKELRYTKEELFSMAQKADPSVSLILPRTMNEGVNCQEYPPGCLSGHIVRVRGLDMLAIEFSNEEEAKYAAKKLKGFYSRNWMFDDVSGEPNLEKFVSTVLNAKKP